MYDDDFITRAVRRLAAALAGTTAAELRAEGDVERARADAALGRARDALAGGDAARALRELDEAIAQLTHLPERRALWIDAGSLRALAPIGGVGRLATLFAVRADVLRAMDCEEEAQRCEELAAALRG